VKIVAIAIKKNAEGVDDVRFVSAEDHEDGMRTIASGKMTSPAGDPAQFLQALCEDGFMSGETVPLMPALHGFVTEVRRSSNNTTALGAEALDEL
jgi:hypothetical protein